MAKKYLENLFTEKQTFQDDMGTGKGGFETTNNVREPQSYGLSFDNRSFGGNTIDSMSSLGGDTGQQSVQGAAQR